MRPAPIIAALSIVMAVTTIRGETTPPPPDPNLPPDYLEQILRLERRKYADYSIPDFFYVDPVRVKVGSGSAVTPMTAVEVFLALRSKDPARPIFGNIDRVVLFARGALVRDIRPDDPNLDRFTDELPAPLDANLPADYREQILRFQRQRNPSYIISSLGCSDPVRVLVHGTGPAGSSREMTVVAFSYGPSSKADGSPYLMIVQGAALFGGGAFVRFIDANDRTVEWVNGRPSEFSGSSAERKRAAQSRLKPAFTLHDPIEGPAERRSIRRQVWARYKAGFEAMALPAATVAKLVDLLEAREEAPLNAQFAAAQKGIDPFSAEMSRAVDTANASAKRDLDDFLGPDRLDTLEYLSGAAGFYRMVMASGGDVQWELRDAGIPMTPGQIVALGKICEDVCDSKRNPDYASLVRQKADPVTGISAAYQEVLERAARILSADQIKIIALRLSDQALQFKMGKPGGPDSAAVTRQGLRGPMMAGYREALAEMNLPAGVESQAKDLLVERESAPFAVWRAARQQGLDTKSDDVRKAMQAATDAVNGRLEALLGAPGCTRLEDFKGLAVVRSQIESSEVNEFGAAGCPLTHDQLQAFGQAVWEVRKSMKPSASANRFRGDPADPRTGLTPQNAAVLARSAAILTARQQEVLRTYYQDLSAAGKRIAAEQNPQKKYPPEDVSSRPQ